MLFSFIDDEQIKEEPNEVVALTAKQQKTALVFIQGAVYAWCNIGEYDTFSVNDFFGGKTKYFDGYNPDWTGTPLQCIDEVCKKRCKGNNKKAEKLALQAVEQLLQTCLMNDERRFDRHTDDIDCDVSYSWIGSYAAEEESMTAEEKEKLRLVMCVLLDAVKVEGTLNYKKVQKRVADENSRLAKQMPYRSGKMGMVLGDLNRHIQGFPPNKPIIPTITAIVVDSQTKVPGEGIDSFPGFENYKEADKSKQRKMTEKEQSKVYDYGYSEWKKIYTKLFG